MKQKRALALGLLGALTFPTLSIPAASATPTVPEEPATTTQQRESERIPVIVMLKAQPDTPSDSGEQTNVATQDSLIATWGPEYGLEVGRQFGYLVNGFSATIPANKLLALSQEPEVESVKRERVYYPNEYNARDMGGVPAAYSDYGVDGTGMVVSIIDTGIDIEHQDMRLDDGVCEESKLTPAEGFTCKVPFGFNYADDNSTVKDLTPSQHGMHVAGIVAANGSIDDTPPNPLDEGRFDGVAPNAQLLAMKVFPNSATGRASDADIIAAIEDSYKLGADVINMSLGSPNGQKDASDGSFRAIEKARENGVVTVVAAGNEGLNFSATGVDDDLIGLHDDATIASPSTQGSAFSVASMDNAYQLSPVAFWNDGADHEMTFLIQGGEATGESFEIVDVGLSLPEDYEGGVDLTGKYALVERGENTFTEKFENAIAAGAEGVVVFNSAEGGNEFVAMAGIEDFDVFSASIYRDNGLEIREALANGPVTVRFTEEQRQEVFADGLRPSSFTSWGPTPTLDFEPEIAGIGGSVYSTLNDNAYGMMSGTSMASPNIAGLTALLMEEYRDRHPELTGPELVDRVQTVLMNTALIPTNADGVPYAPRQIGAGLAQIDQALNTNVYATVDGKPAVALREVTGNRSISVTLTNTGDSPASYTIPSQEVVSETNNANEVVTTFVSDESLTPNVREVTVPAGGTATVEFTLVPDTSYDHYIEGWVAFTGNGVPDISVPYLGFVGDWNAEPIIEAPGQPWIEGLETATTDLVMSLFGLTMPIDLGGGPWISPNGDGLLDDAVPQILFKRNAAEVVYDIYTADENGQPLEFVKSIGKDQGLYRNIGVDVITYPDDAAYVATTQTFDGTVWNAETGDFEQVPDGAYVYKISATLGADFESQETLLPFGIDTTPPEITVGDFDGTTLSVTLSDEGSGLLYEYDENGDASVIPLDAYAADGSALEVADLGDGEFEVTVPDGTPYVQLAVLDFAFNESVVVEIFEESALYVTDPDPEADNVYGIGTPETFDGEYTVAGYMSSDITRVTINGEDATIVNNSFAGIVPLTEGENTIEIIGYNEAGDEVDRATATIDYDGEYPTIEITNLNDNGELAVGDDGSVLVEGVISDNRDEAELTVTIDDTEVEVAEDGTFSYTFTPDESVAAIAIVGSDGPNDYTLSVPLEGRALEGDFALPSFTNVDCDAAFAYCFIPNDGADMIDDNTFLLKGYIDSPVSSFTLTPTSYVDEATGEYVHPDPLTITPDADGYFEVPINVETGLNDIRITVVDVDGNTVIDQSAKFYFDITAPTIEFIEPLLKGGTLFTNTEEVTFAGTASDDGWGYELFLNDSSIEEVYYNSGLGPESNEREFSTQVRVADGDQVLVQFVDANGNTLLGIIPVVLDQVAPEHAHTYTDGDGVVQNVDHAFLENGEPVVTTATDENLASLQVSLNGEVIAEQFANIGLVAAPVHDWLVDLRDVEETEDSEGSEGESDDSVADVDPESSEATEADETAKPLAIEENVSGTLAESLDTTLTHTLQTADLAAGKYTLTAVSQDLAGNTTTSAVTFTVDDKPVIEGTDAIELVIDREQLGDQAGLAELVLEQYSVTDDGTWNGGENATLSLAPGTVLVDGENTVTIVATDINGQRTTREVTVTITLNERTLEDNGVTATGTFRSDDTLTVTITGDNPQVVAVTNEFGTIPAVLTIPGPEDAVVYQVIGQDKRILVDATWADGIWTIHGNSKGVYLLEVPSDEPGAPDPEDPGQPVNPGDGEDPTPGDPGETPGDDQTPGEDQTPGDGDSSPAKPGEDQNKPGTGPSDPLAKTGADIAGLITVSVVFIAAGIAAFMVRRRIG